MIMAVVAVLLAVLLMSGWGGGQEAEPVQRVSDGGCVVDSDCVVYGQTGDCNCGCYTEGNLPAGTGGECFCAAPTSCQCVNSQCEGVYGEEEI